MVPAKTRFPSIRNLEYSGYLMSAYKGDSRYVDYRTMFECVDKNPDSIPGSASDINGALFHHAEATAQECLVHIMIPRRN